LMARGVLLKAKNRSRIGWRDAGGQRERQKERSRNKLRREKENATTEKFSGKKSFMDVADLQGKGGRGL